MSLSHYQVFNQISKALSQIKEVFNHIYIIGLMYTRQQITLPAYLI